MRTIQIDIESCVKCGHCVKVCPAQIFTQAEKRGPIGVEHEDRCIVCGHCVDACPKGAVIHSDFPAEAVHPIDYQSQPSPEQLMSLIKSRRSNRALSERPVPEEALQKILEAANCAPTATNSEKVGYTLITSPDDLRAVADFTIGVFSRLLKILNNPLIRFFLKPLKPDVYRYVPVFKSLKKRHKKGKDPILRNAKALILIHTPEDYRFGAEDCNLAYQNASLMAQSLGVSQIYMGFVLTALKQKGQKKFTRQFGIEGRHIHAIMALGIPEFAYPNYVDRKPMEVTRR